MCNAKWKQSKSWTYFASNMSRWPTRMNQKKIFDRHYVPHPVSKTNSVKKMSQELFKCSFLAAIWTECNHQTVLRSCQGKQNVRFGHLKVSSYISHATQCWHIPISSSQIMSCRQSHHTVKKECRNLNQSLSNSQCEKYIPDTVQIDDKEPGFTDCIFA